MLLTHTITYVDISGCLFLYPIKCGGI